MFLGDINNYSWSKLPKVFITYMLNNACLLNVFNIKLRNFKAAQQSNNVRISI